MRQVPDYGTVGVLPVRGLSASSLRFRPDVWSYAHRSTFDHANLDALMVTPDFAVAREERECTHGQGHANAAPAEDDPSAHAIDEENCQDWAGLSVNLDIG